MMAGGVGRRDVAVGWRGVLLAGVAVVGLSACAAQTDPVSVTDMRAQVKADLEKLFSRQEPIAAPLTIHDVMARVLKYNLDNKLKVMEEALAQRQVDVANLGMLPRMAASAGYVARSSPSASSSKSVTTGRQSLETSTSQDEHRQTSDLSMVWNVLDFGVSYVSAMQQTDRAKVADERRRKVVHNVLQDTRTVYWRAVAAERLQDRIAPLLKRIDQAMRDSRTINELKLTSPLEALAYQRQLLKTRQQLLDLQRELQVAKSQLATLMDLPPATNVPLAVAKRSDKDVPKIALEPQKIEEIALLRRPELVEEAYQARIGAAETRKAMLRMLPGIELNLGLNFDSNSYLLYNRWADYGARAVWNLFNVVTGPANIALAEAQESFIETRRLALSMAVLTQSRVSWLRYRQALDAWKVAQDLEKVEKQISTQMRDEVAAERRGALAVIQADFDALLSDLGADLAFAETQNAAGNMLVSMGFDPLPDDLKTDNLDDIAAALRSRESDWFAGRVQIEPPPPAPDAPAPAPVSAEPPPPPVVEKPMEKTIEPVAALVTPEPAAPAPAPVASASDAPVSAPAPAPAPAVAGYQVGLGAFANQALAAESWEAITRRHGRRVANLTPLYVTAIRRGDGKEFVILRAAGFADFRAADMFCRKIENAQQSCRVKAPA